MTRGAVGPARCRFICVQERIFTLQLPGRRLWPQVIVALLLTAGATGFVLHQTWEADSWTAMLSFNPGHLAVATALLVCAWLIDAGRMQAVCRAMGYRVTTKAALRSNLLGYFLSSVTPFTAGGGPLQVYSLHRSGVPVGYATAAVLVNGFFAHFSLALSGTFIVFGCDVAAGLNPRIYQWLRISIFVYMGVLLVLAFSVWHVERGRRLIKKVIWPLLRFFTDKRRARSAIVAVDKVVTDLHHGLRTAARHWTWALLGFVACFGYFAVFFAIVPTLAAGLGLTPPFWQVAAIVVPVFLFASILPTPGGSGGLELGLAQALLQYVSAAHSGIIVATWRLLTYYVVVAISGTAVLLFVRAELARAAKSNGAAVLPAQTGLDKTRATETVAGSLSSATSVQHREALSPARSSREQPSKRD